MKPIESVIKLIRDLRVLDINTSTEMDRQIKYDILKVQKESKRTKSAAIVPNLRRIIMKSPITKYAALIALICTGVAAAAVVGVKIHKWRFVDKHPEAGYMLHSEDGTVTNIPDSWADSPEHAVKVKEELDLLKQQDAGELVSVIEKEVNGKLIRRTFMFKYVLSDGREIKSGDFDPDFKESMTEAQEEEVISLLRADEFVTIGFEEKEFRGRTFSFERNRFVLSDGTEVIWSVGRPSEDSQSEVKTIVKDAKEADQILKDKREIANLRQQDKRKLLKVEETMTDGTLQMRVHVYKYELSDGRTMDMGESAGGDFALDKAQWDEWARVSKAGPGEYLGTYEETVEGRVFSFKRERYSLSDGTEVIRSVGTPKDDQ